MKWTILTIAIFLAIAGCAAQKVAGYAPKPFNDEAPITIIPLSDADALAMRDLQYKQDQLIVKLSELKHEADETQHQIDAMQQQIQEKAGQIAQANHIDTSKMSLNLDLHAWTAAKEAIK